MSPNPVHGSVRKKMRTADNPNKKRIVSYVDDPEIMYARAKELGLSWSGYIAGLYEADKHLHSVTAHLSAEMVDDLVQMAESQGVTPAYLVKRCIVRSVTEWRERVEL